MDDTNNQMPNNENQNDSNQYQDILNQYTQAMNSVPEDNQTPKVVNPESKEETPLLIKTDQPLSISDNIDVDENEKNTINQPEITQEPVVPETQPEPSIPAVSPISPAVESAPVKPEGSPIPPRPENSFEPLENKDPVETSSEPEKTPEEIKKEIDALLNESKVPEETPDIPFPPTKSSGTGFFKTLFFISLIIFLGVSGVLAYNLLNNPQKNNNSSTNENNTIINVTPTVMDTTGVNCVINEIVLNVGDTFAANDNCNTCICNADATIGCTEEKCPAVTPSVSPIATPSTAKKVTPALK